MARFTSIALQITDRDVWRMPLTVADARAELADAELELDAAEKAVEDERTGYEDDRASAAERLDEAQAMVSCCRRSLARSLDFYGTEANYNLLIGR